MQRRRFSNPTARRRLGSNFNNLSYEALEPRQLLAGDFFVGAANSGIAVSDDATGTGFILYSNEAVATRFGGLNPDNAENFIAIQLDGTQWQYNNDSTWIDFDPVDGDVIVAEVNFDGDSVSTAISLPPVIQGIPLVNVEGQLYFAANRFGDVEDVGEFALLGDCIDTDLSQFANPFTTAAFASSPQRLSQIAIGALQYESVTREFPNLAIFDDAGAPLLSWRVQILPFLGLQDLYSQFNLDEAWNSPHNLTLLDQIPDVFQSQNFQSDTHTVFQAIGGENTLFPLASDNIGFREITDGAANTILFAEANADRATEWTRPVDLTYLEGNPLSGLGNISDDGFAVATANAATYIIPNDIDPSNFGNLVERNDGEVVDFSEFAPFGYVGSNLRQISLAAQNFESSNQRFPANAIYSDTGEPLLSWRVAILPFIEQNALYERFNLDEPWDSPNNIALLPLIPQIYRTEGLGDGLTNYVGVSGSGTIFELADQGLTFGQIPDGTGNTLMFVEADPDQIAVEWTRPVDLVVDPANPIAGLGTPGDVSFRAAFADGSVHEITNPDPDNLANLLLRDDGEPVDLSGIVTFNNIANNLRQVALGAHNFESANQHFPTDLFEPGNPDGPALLSWRVRILPFIGHSTLYNMFDLNASWDSPQNLALLPFMPRVFASDGVANGLTVIQGSSGADTLFPGTENDQISFGEISDGTTNTALILQVDDDQAVEWTRPADLPYDPASPQAGLGGNGVGFWVAMADASVRFIDNTVTADELGYFLERNDGLSFLTNHLAPTPSTISSNSNATFQNNIRQVALAWHNYESAFRHFPPHAIYSEPVNQGGTPLLSWRVALLPFLGQGDLYDQFNLDEPWDSPHNLALVEFMPAIFSHPQLNSADGLTLLQTFTSSPGDPSTISPLANRGLDFGDIRDGLTNTLLFAESNLDQAVIWTQPDDILYDPADPSSSIGEIAFGLGSRIALADGSPHFLSGCTSDEVLNNLIQIDDGNVVPGISNGGSCNEGVVQPSVVAGTAGDDFIEIVMLEDVVQVFVNGDRTDFDSDEYDLLVIDTLGGNDEVFLRDGNEDSQTEISPGLVTVDGDTSVRIEGAEKVTVDSGGGFDVARLVGSQTQDNQFFGSVNSSLLITGGLEYSVLGYDEVVAVGGAGSDQAFFADTAGNDVFTANPQTAQISVGDRFVRANDFELFSAVSRNGGDDSASLTDSEADEQFFGSAALSRITGGDYTHNVVGFKTVIARTVGGDDSAVLVDSAGDDFFFANGDLASISNQEDGSLVRAVGYEQARGFSRNGGEDVASLSDQSSDPEFRSNDQLVAAPDSVTLFVGNGRKLAAGFGVVNSFSTNGQDEAFLIGSEGDENFFADPRKSRLVGDQFFNFVSGFSLVQAFSNGGVDRALMFDSQGDDEFFASPSFATLSGVGFRTSTSGFQDVRAIGSAGNDTASFVDSNGDDTFVATPDVASMQGSNFFNLAQGFGRVTAFSSNAGDLAQLQGSAGDDRFSRSVLSSSLSGTGYFNVAVGFANVSAFGNGGDDTASIADSTGDDRLLANDSQLTLTGEEDEVSVNLFLLGYDTVFANSINGGTNEFDSEDLDFDLFLNGIWV